MFSGVNGMILRIWFVLLSVISFVFLSAAIPQQTDFRSSFKTAVEELRTSLSEDEAAAILLKHFPNTSTIGYHLASEPLATVVKTLDPLPTHALSTVLKAIDVPQIGFIFFLKSLSFLSDTTRQRWLPLLLEADLYKIKRRLTGPSPRQIYTIMRLGLTLGALATSSLPITVERAAQISETVKVAFLAKEVPLNDEWEHYYNMVNPALDLFFEKAILTEPPDSAVRQSFIDLLQHLVREMTELRRMIKSKRHSTLVDIDLCFYVLQHKAADIALRLQLESRQLDFIRNLSDLSTLDWHELECARKMMSKNWIPGPYISIRSIVVTAQSHTPDRRKNIVAITRGDTLRFELPISLIKSLGPTPEDVTKAVETGRLDALLRGGVWVVYPRLSKHHARFFPLDAELPVVTEKTGPLEIWDSYWPQRRQRLAFVTARDRSQLPPQATFWTVLEQNLFAPSEQTPSLPTAPRSPTCSDTLGKISPAESL